MTQDTIHRFSFQEAPIRGQWVHLDGVIAELLRRRRYPEPIGALLGEMLAAVALMADGIKFPGTLALQSQGDGPVSTTLAECRDHGLLRGFARGDWNDAPGRREDPPEALLGSGQLMVSFTPDPDAGPQAGGYQGVVGIESGSLAENLEAYFSNSEQLPTRLYFAHSGGRTTGLLLQRLPARDRATEVELDQHADLWHEVQLLADSLRPGELAELPVTTLLQRLFHQQVVVLHPGRALQFGCTCSRERAERMLQALPKDEILELLETEGLVDVTCEVCGARYDYDRVDAHALYQPEGLQGRQLH